ncbi:MAG: SDR family oxidoreductase [Phaeodactylibacter sp.]|nr:SDR family oxidoreductase [Phaeodactylibacter sp.]
MNAVITGATKGIGYAIAQAFAAGGFDLAVTARSAEDLRAMRRSFASYFPDSEVLALPANLGHKDEAKNFAREVLGHFSTVDVLVNNAGLFLADDITEEEDYVLEQMMTVNLFGPYYLTKALLPAMKERHQGHIFNICSTASREAEPDKGAYGVTKFALLGFTKALRLELQGHGVRVTAVLPGATWSSSWEGTGVPEESLMRAEDVALAVWNAWSMSRNTVVEEILMRPQG